MASWRPYSMVKAVDIEISSVSTALLFSPREHTNVPCFAVTMYLEANAS